MSSSYTKLIPEPVSYKMYGFQRCSAKDVYSIVRRLRHSTYNTELYHGERFKEQPCPPRAPSAICKKAKAAASIEFRPARPIPVFTTEKDLERAYRRVRATTISKMAAEGKVTPTYESVSIKESYNAITPHEQNKLNRRLLRPTTATKHRTWFSTLEEDSGYVENDIYDYEYVSGSDIQSIVDRVATPTIASEGGIGPTCPKRKDSIGKRAIMKDVPLISGLPRSKNIYEIVNRLCPPRESLSICRRPVSAIGSPRLKKKQTKHRPKSAFASLGPTYLSSLSSLSSETLSDSRPSSSQSNRSKFSTVSDDETKSAKISIVIQRKRAIRKDVDNHNEITNRKPTVTFDSSNNDESSQSDNSMVNTTGNSQQHSDDPDKSKHHKTNKKKSIKYEDLSPLSTLTPSSDSDNEDKAMTEKKVSNFNKADMSANNKDYSKPYNSSTDNDDKEYNTSMESLKHDDDEKEYITSMESFPIQNGENDKSDEYNTSMESYRYNSDEKDDLNKNMNTSSDTSAQRKDDSANNNLNETKISTSGSESNRHKRHNEDSSHSNNQDEDKDLSKLSKHTPGDSDSDMDANERDFRNSNLYADKKFSGMDIVPPSLSNSGRSSPSSASMKSTDSNSSDMQKKLDKYFKP